MSSNVTKPPTVAEIATMAGVSTATVMRVLKGNGYVAEATRKRVTAAIDLAGYRPNMTASNLRTQRSRTIGLMLSAITVNPFFVNVARGVEDRAIRQGYQTVLFNHDDDPELERRNIERFLERRVDAILFCNVLRPENAALAVEAGVPIVQIERAVTRSAASVTVDNYVGATEAMAHLLALGHRRIAYLGGDPALFPLRGRRPLSVEEERLKAYRDAMTNAGLTPPKDYVRLGLYYRMSDRGSGEIGRAHMEALLALPRPPTAVFATCDILAAGALQALYAAGLRVPSDMSIVGFDDTLAPNLTPSLTSVAQPMEEMGRKAFDRALDAIENANSEPSETVLGTWLEVRDSTAPPTA